MELFNIDNPFYEKWKPGRPSYNALAKRALYWQYEKDNFNITKRKQKKYKPSVDPIDPQFKISIS